VRFLPFLLGALQLFVLSWSPLAGAAPLRVLVAAGQVRGAAEQGVLKHANRDAERVRDVFVAQGRVLPGNAILVRDATQASLFAALERARQLAATARKRDVTFIFYFSGHGDRSHLQLDGQAVSMRELKRRIKRVRAGLRLVISDACRTTEPTHAKGVTSAEPFSISVEPASASGSIWLYASADGEAAQESEVLSGAVFTHFFVTGLKGAADRNRDRQVTLAEAWAFAYHQTLYRSARGSGVLQRPAAVYRLKESAPLVLTYRDRGLAELSLPPARDTHYLIYSTGTKTVAAEFWAVPDRAATISLPAGQYLVQRRGAAGPGALSISLGRGEKRGLSAADFRAVAPEVLAAKGGELLLRPYDVRLTAGPVLSTLSGLTPRLGLGLGLQLSELALDLRLGATSGKRNVGANDVDVRALDAGLTLDWVVVAAAPLQLRFGAGPALLGVVQTIQRSDPGSLTALGLDLEQRHTALAVGGGARAAARYVFGERWFFELDVRGAVLGVRRGAGVSALYGASSDLSAGLAF